MEWESHLDSPGMIQLLCKLIRVVKKELCCILISKQFVFKTIGICKIIVAKFQIVIFFHENIF